MAVKPVVPPPITTIFFFPSTVLEYQVITAGESKESKNACHLEVFCLSGKIKSMFHPGGFGESNESHDRQPEKSIHA